MNFIYLIGLTGGIAEAKTTCLKIFKQLGAVTLDADHVAHRVYEKGSPLEKRLVSEFGSTVIDGEGINRRALGRMVFQNENAMKKLTDIVWPEMLRVINEKIHALRLTHPSQKDPILFILEAAVLCEAKWHLWMDHIIVTRTHSQDIIKERIISRDPDLSLTDIDARLSCSMDKRKIIDQAATISPERFTYLDTGTSLDHLKQQVEHCYQNMKRLALIKQQDTEKIHLGH